MIDERAKDQKTVTLLRYLAEEDRFDKLLENPQVMKMPVVRNGRQATIGYQPKTWKDWE